MHKRHPHLRLALATATAAALTGGLLTVSAAAADSTTVPQADFNGDGYGDLVVSAPKATAGSVTGAGAVVVTYGSKSGLTSTKKKVISQATSGVPGTPEKDDGFGTATAAGDFDGDGYTDLAVGTPGENVGDAPQGAVTFLWGSSSGLTGTAGSLPLGTGFYESGQTLAAGDLDGDGIIDLVIGESKNTVFFTQGGVSRKGVPDGMGGITTPVTNASGGVASLATGDVNGDGISDLVVGGNVRAETQETFTNSLYLFAKSAQDITYWGDVANGTQTSVADLDGDGYGDIVTGNPLEPSSWMTTDYAGGVTIRYGCASGVDTGRAARSITQNTSGIPGASEEWDSFGASVSVGDINADGHPDLAIGAPQETIGDDGYTGSVTVVYGTANGPTGTGSRAYSQDTAGVPGTAEADDRFGDAVRLSDTNADGKADLAIGATGENDSDGALWSLRGASSGITTTGGVSFGPATLGIPTTGTPRFGTPITG
ncbi:FG-GAP-like repeat-containing protein [Streptomyces sp. 142MFCol3.1]|uniref:FG-GAP-like repeat-containing protein n=1 Tax=Streptomyces sp. 142MFCol3.1 TaxID=1172179 RepID=UPI00040F5FB8|nr:FG-GAP-like repeat-containing protein [Streptomyces sp. 142MFCol3.1]